MTTADHIAFIEKKGKFIIDCGTKIFSLEEIEYLEKYGHWSKALIDGELLPITEGQKDFIDKFKNNKKPITPEQVAWWKYRGRKRLEEKNPEKFNFDYTSDAEDPFFNRADWNKMRKWVNR